MWSLDEADVIIITQLKCPGDEGDEGVCGDARARSSMWFPSSRLFQTSAWSQQIFLTTSVNVRGFL